MSEAKRWHRSINLEGATKVYEVVLASDFDAAQSELAVLSEHIELLTADLAWSENDSRDQSKELSALREELAKAKVWASQYAELESVFHSERDIWNRESSANSKAQGDLQQRLTAAEQRNAELVALLTEHQWDWEPYDSHSHRPGGYYCVECQEPKDSGHEAGCKLADALKPTESGSKRMNKVHMWQSLSMLGLIRVKCGRKVKATQFTSDRSKVTCAACLKKMGASE